MADHRFVFMVENEQNQHEPSLDTLIESWDSLTNSNEENVNLKFINLFKETGNLILQMTWTKLKPDLKYRLTLVLKKCLDNFKSCSKNSELISALVDLSMTDPWHNTALKMILNSQTSDLSNIETQKVFCESMNSEVLWLHLQTLIQNGCEDLALKLCTCCLNFSSLKNEERLHDMYYRLLFQLSFIDRLTNELSSYTSKKGIDFVNRVLISSDNDELAFASCLIQIFLVRDIFSQSTYSYTKNLMQMWINVQYKLNINSQLLWEQVMMLASIFTTSAHYYLMVDLLFTQFGSKLLRLYVELYIKGLTVDLNFLENARREQTDNVNELETHFADVLCKLAEILGDHSLLARECFLSAFSINPTIDRMKQLERFAVVDNLKPFSDQKFVPCSGFCHCIIQGACRQSKTCAENEEVKKLLIDVLDKITENEIEPWNVSHYIFEKENNDLSESILEDLTIVLDEPRNKTLSWELKWTELKERCEIYLETKSAMKVMLASLAKEQKPEFTESKFVIKTGNSSDIKKNCNVVSTNDNSCAANAVKLQQDKQMEGTSTEPYKIAVSEANPMFYLDRPTKETSFLKEALTRTNLIKLVRVTDLKAKGEPVLLEELRKREFNSSQSLVSFKSVPYFNAIPLSCSKTSITKEKQAIIQNLDVKTVTQAPSKLIQPLRAQSIEMNPKVVAKTVTATPSLLVKAQSLVPAFQVQCDNSLKLPITTSEPVKPTVQKCSTSFIQVPTVQTENLIAKTPLQAHTALVKAGLTMDQMNPKVVISHSDMADANKLLINSEKVWISSNQVAVTIGSKDKTKSPNGINSEMLKNEKSPKKGVKKSPKNKKDGSSLPKTVGTSIQLPVMQIMSPMQLQSTAENQLNFMTLTQSTPKTVSKPVQVYSSPMIASSVVIPVQGDQKNVTSQKVLGGIPSATFHVKLVDNNVSFAKSTTPVARPSTNTGGYVLLNARCAVVNSNASTSGTKTETIRIVSQPSLVAPVVTLQSSLQSGAEFTKATNSSVSTKAQDVGVLNTTNSSLKVKNVINDDPLSNSAEDTIPLSEALLDLYEDDEEVDGPATDNKNGNLAAEQVQMQNSTLELKKSSQVTSPPVELQIAKPVVAPDLNVVTQRETAAANEDDLRNKMLKSETATLYSNSGATASTNLETAIKLLVMGEKQPNQTTGQLNLKPLANSQVMMVPQKMVHTQAGVLSVTQNKTAQQLVTVNSVVLPAGVQATSETLGLLIEPEAKINRKGKLFPSRKKTGPKWTSVRNQHGGMEYRLLKGSPEKGHQKKVVTKTQLKTVITTQVSSVVTQTVPVTTVSTISNLNQVKKVELSSLKSMQKFSRIVTTNVDCTAMINPNYSLTTISNLKTFKINRPENQKLAKGFDKPNVPKTAEDEKIMKILDEYKEKAMTKTNPMIIAPAVASVKTELVEPVCLQQVVDQEHKQNLTVNAENILVNEDLSALCNSPSSVNLQPFVNDVLATPINDTMVDIHCGMQISNTLLEQPLASKNTKKKSLKRKSPSAKQDNTPTSDESPKKKLPRKTPAVKAICPECGKEFSNGYNVNRHLRYVHHQDDVKTSPRKCSKKKPKPKEPTPLPHPLPSPIVADDDAANVNIPFMNDERVEESLEKYFSDENNCDFRACMSDYQPSFSDIVNSDFEREFNLFNDPEMSESACLANDNSSNTEIKSDFNTGYVEETVNNGFNICSSLQTTNSPRTILERFSYIKKEPEEVNSNYPMSMPLVKSENEETDDNSRSKTGRMRARNSSHGSKRCACCDSSPDSSKKFRSDTTTRALRQVRITKLRVPPLDGKQIKSVLRR